MISLSPLEVVCQPGKRVAFLGRFAGGVNFFGVVSQGFGEVFEDAQIIDDQAVLLAGAVESIGAAHGLG